MKGFNHFEDNLLITILRYTSGPARESPGLRKQQILTSGDRNLLKLLKIILKKEILDHNINSNITLHDFLVDF